MRPLASKMTPEPMAVPVPDWPVVGSVSVAPSAVIVTTAGLTALTMSTTLAWAPGASGATVAAGVGPPFAAPAGACVWGVADEAGGRPPFSGGWGGWLRGAGGAGTNPRARGAGGGGAGGPV